MRLSDLLEGDNNTYTGPRVAHNTLGYMYFTPEVIEKAVEEVMQSPEYKELIKIVPMVSNKTRLEHGLLSFQISQDTRWEINVQGNIRLRKADQSSWNAGNVETRGLLKAAKVDINASLVDRYIANIKEMIVKLQKQSTAQSKSFENEEGQDVKSLTDLDLSGVVNSLTINMGSLRDLQGCPTPLNNLTIRNNKEILSLKGCPERIGGTIKFYKTELTDLEFLPKKIGKILFLDRCPAITSLSGIGKKFVLSCKEINIWDTKINSSMLGILLVKNLQRLDYNRYTDNIHIKALLIIEKHFNGDRDIINCKEELIAAGLKEYAKL